MNLPKYFPLPKKQSYQQNVFKDENRPVIKH